MDTGALDRMALRLEADAHRGGWDGDPGCFVVYEHADADTEQAYARLLGPRATCGPYAARTMVHTHVLCPAPAHALYRLALNLTQTPDNPWTTAYLAEMRRPGFVGVALQFEGWFWDGSPEERAAIGGRSLADVPGSKENRMVVLATGEGVLHVAQRMRGEKPGIIAGYDASTGAVVESLLIIAAVIAGKPAPELTCTPAGWEG